MEVFVSISQQVSSRGVGMGVRFSADVNLPVSLVSFFFPVSAGNFGYVRMLHF